MLIREREARSILNPSRIPSIDYSLNPYTGCAHACRYCYAEFMKKYTNHPEPWGSFVDVKINAAALLEKEITKKKRGTICMSTVTDPYQPIEATRKITQQCLEVLAKNDWPVSILTKSDLVLRDIALLKLIKHVEVGLTITTDNERIRGIFEPNTVSIERRIAALRRLKECGIITYVFIGPILPMKIDNLKTQLKGLYNDILIDAMNYRWKSQQLFAEYNLLPYLSSSFVQQVRQAFLKV